MTLFAQDPVAGHARGLGGRDAPDHRKGALPRGGGAALHHALLVRADEHWSTLGGVALRQRKTVVQKFSRFCAEV